VQHNGLLPLDKLGILFFQFFNVLGLSIFAKYVFENFKTSIFEAFLHELDKVILIVI